MFASGSGRGDGRCPPQGNAATVPDRHRWAPISRPCEKMKPGAARAHRRESFAACRSARSRFRRAACISASGRRAFARSRSRSTARPPIALDAEADGYFSGLVARCAARHALPFRPDTRDRLLPDPASRFQPDGPHGPSEVVDPGAFRWTDRDWRGRPREEQVIYEMHVGTFTPEGTLGGGGARAAGAGRARHHLHRADAGRRFPGPLRLGLRRRRPVRADPALRPPGRLPPLRRPRARARPRRDPRRRLQPPRPGRQLPRAVLASLLHRSLRERMGRGDQLRRRRRRAGARVLPRQRRLLDRRVPPRRPAPRRDAADLRRLGRPHPGRDRARGCARRRGGRDTFVVGENEPQDTPPGAAAGARRLRPRRAVERRLPSQRDGRADRPARGLLHRLPRHAAGVRRRGQVRLSLSGPALRLAEASGAARRRSTCRPTRSSSFCRTTTRSPTRARGLRVPRS